MRQNYPLTLLEIAVLADVIALADVQTVSPRHKRLISRAHQILQAALGEDVGLVYLTDDAPEAA